MTVGENFDRESLVHTVVSLQRGRSRLARIGYDRGEQSSNRGERGKLKTHLQIERNEIEMLHF